MADDCKAPGLEEAARLRAEADRIERETLRAALTEANGSELGAAKILGITRDKLHAMIRRRHTDIADAARAMRIAAGGPIDGSNPRLRSKLQVVTSVSKGE